MMMRSMSVSRIRIWWHQLPRVLSSPPVNAREPLMEVGEFILPGLPPLSNDIAFMFPGQGSQYVGMIEPCAMIRQHKNSWPRLTKLLQRFPVGQFRKPITLPGWAGWSRAARSAGSGTARDRDLPTGNLYVSAILLDQVRRLGIDCGMAMGHSLGEYTALYAAGILNFDDTLTQLPYGTPHGHIAGQGIRYHGLCECRSRNGEQVTA